MQRRGIFKRGAALDVGDFALLGENAEAAGEFLDYALFPRTQARQIDFRRGEIDAPVFRLLRFLDQLGHVQQRFRRDAAAVEADSAGVRFWVDQRDGHAQIGGKKRGGVASGTGADYCDIERWCVRHD